MDDRRVKCYHVINNHAYEEEPEPESKAKLVGSNDIEEQESCFMVGPVPFDCSTLTLPIDFQAIE